MSDGLFLDNVQSTFLLSSFRKVGFFEMRLRGLRWKRNSSNVA